jgi:hypothetical protein
LNPQALIIPPEFSAPLSFGGWSTEDDLVYASSSDKVKSTHVIHVWRAATLTLERTLNRHTARIIALRESPLDSDILLSAGHDGRICLWSLSRGTCLREFLVTGNNPVDDSVIPLECLDIQFSQCGTYIAATDIWGQIHLFSLGEVDSPTLSWPVQQFFMSDIEPISHSDRLIPHDVTRNCPVNEVHPHILVGFEGGPHHQEFQTTHTPAERLAPFFLPTPRERISAQQTISSIEIERFQASSQPVEALPVMIQPRTTKKARKSVIIEPAPEPEPEPSSQVAIAPTQEVFDDDADPSDDEEFHPASSSDVEQLSTERFGVFPLLC